MTFSSSIHLPANDKIPFFFVAEFKNPLLSNHELGSISCKDLGRQLYRQKRHEERRTKSHIYSFGSSVVQVNDPLLLLGVLEGHGGVGSFQSSICFCVT
jgi:hypothetical protein